MLGTRVTLGYLPWLLGAVRIPGVGKLISVDNDPRTRTFSGQKPVPNPFFENRMDGRVLLCLLPLLPACPHVCACHFKGDCPAEQMGGKVKFN